MYTGDNDGYFERDWEGTEYSTSFFEVLQPYCSMKEKGVNLCPMATKPWSEGGVLGMPDAAWGVWGEPGLPAIVDFMTDPEALGDYGSYGGNGWISNPSPTDVSATDPVHAKFWRTPDIRGGSIVPVVMDSLWIGWFIDDDDPDSMLAPSRVGDYFSDSPGMKLFCIDRHDRTVNMLFLDWSARKVDLKELWTLRWHRQFDINNWMTRAGGMTRGEWPEWFRDTPDY